MTKQQKGQAAKPALTNGVTDSLKRFETSASTDTSALPTRRFSDSLSTATKQKGELYWLSLNTVGPVPQEVA